MGDVKGGSPHSHAGDRLVGEIEKNYKWTQRPMVICILERNSQEGRLSKFLSVFSEQKWKGQSVPG